MDLEFEVMRDLELLEENEEIECELRRKIPRVNFTDAQNPMEYMNDKSFYDNLAFTKEQFLIVLDKFKDKFAAFSENKTDSLKVYSFMQSSLTNCLIATITSTEKISKSSKKTIWKESEIAKTVKI